MSIGPTASLDAATRTQVLRHARSLIARTLAFFEQRQEEQLKLLRAHLFDLVDGTPHMGLAQNLRTAAMMLDKSADVFNRSFQSALQESIEQEWEAIMPGALAVLRPGTGSDDSVGPASLALLDVDEIERHLLVDRVSQRFNARYEVNLARLTQLVGALLRVEDYASSDNPFRPATLIRAFSLAWQMSGFDPEAAEDFVVSLSPQHNLDWAPLYAELAETLVRAGFSAQAVHRIKRTPSGDSAPAPLQAEGGAARAARSGFGELEAGEARAGGGDGAAKQGRSAWGELAPAAGRAIVGRARQFLQKLGFGQPADWEDTQGTADAPQPGGAGGREVGPGAAARHVPADAAFMGFLGGLQAGAGVSTSHPWVQGQDLGGQNLLRQMRERDEVQRAPEIDRGTVDALAEVFDYVFADRSIPTQLKVVIGRLQIPVLKAAMIDRDFFLASDHPARKLVDALASAAVAWLPEKGEADPLYVRIETTVKRVLAEFEDDLNLFVTLVAEFNAFMLANEQRVQSQLDPLAHQEQDGEAMELALAHADEVVHHCIDSHTGREPLAPFLLPFLGNQWRQVMARAWVGASAAPADWDAALNTMDQVIWSTQPKTQADERARLVALLPDLVSRINASLDQIGWAGEERAVFTRRLIATHMKAIRSPRAGPVAPDSSPAELEVDAGRDAMKALHDRRARSAARAGDGFDDMAQGLARGLWFEFADEQQVVRRYRLGWVSPKRTRLLFTNRDGFEAFVRTQAEVAALLREGRLRVLDQQPIVARAIDRIMSADDETESGLALL